jgi:hypothetical protein
MKISNLQNVYTVHCVIVLKKKESFKQLAFMYRIKRGPHEPIPLVLSPVTTVTGTDPSFPIWDKRKT